MNDYKIESVLGEGAYGKVFLVTNQEGQEFALKRLQKKYFSEVADLYIETSFGLLFPENTPLLKINDMFLK